MRIDHVFDGVGNDLSRRQGVEHAAVAHGDAIVYGDGVKFLRHATSFANGVSHDVANIFKMDVTRNELGIRVSDSDDWLAEIVFFSAGRAPESARTSSLPADGGYFRAQRKHVERS